MGEFFKTHLFWGRTQKWARAVSYLTLLFGQADLTYARHFQNVLSETCGFHRWYISFLWEHQNQCIGTRYAASHIASIASNCLTAVKLVLLRICGNVLRVTIWIVQFPVKALNLVRIGKTEKFGKPCCSTSIEASPLVDAPSFHYCSLLVCRKSSRLPCDFLKVTFDLIPTDSVV